MKQVARRAAAVQNSSAEGRASRSGAATLAGTPTHNKQSHLYIAFNTK